MEGICICNLGHWRYIIFVWKSCGEKCLFFVLMTYPVSIIFEARHLSSCLKIMRSKGIYVAGK